MGGLELETTGWSARFPPGFRSRREISFDNRRRRGKPGEALLETEVPSAQRLLVPPIDELDAEGFRRLVDEAAGHKGVLRGAVVWSMLKRPKE